MISLTNFPLLLNFINLQDPASLISQTQFIFFGSITTLKIQKVCKDIKITLLKWIAFSYVVDGNVFENTLIPLTENYLLDEKKNSF